MYECMMFISSSTFDWLSGEVSFALLYILRFGIGLVFLGYF